LFAQPAVRIGFGNVGEVTGENKRVNLLIPRPKSVENASEVRRDVDRGEELAIPTKQVGVGNVGEDV
jgi:hypothetical protein